LVSDKPRPNSLLELSRDIVTTFPGADFRLDSVLVAAIAEKEGERFFLQPVVLTADQFVQCVSEIATQTPERLRTR